MPRANVDEMNVDAVDGGDELRKRVQPRLDLAPVVFLAPVAHQLLELCQLGALGLIRNGFTIGPTRCQQAPAEVDEIGLRNVDAEGADCAFIRRSSQFGKHTESARRGNAHGRCTQKVAAIKIDVLEHDLSPNFASEFWGLFKYVCYAAARVR
jgi:hypothetical protein